MTGWRRSLLWLPAAAYAVLIFHLSSQSRIPVILAHVWDKLLHAGGFGFMTALFVFALEGRLAPVRWRPAILAVLLTVLYGASDEFHQSFVPGRDASLLDLLADGVGAAIAVIALGAYSLLRARRLARARSS